jgi:thiol-disulfide isomerase/thioredoxin
MSQEEFNKQRAEITKVVDEALKGVDLDAVPADKAGQFAQLLSIVGRRDKILSLVDKFLTTNPTGDALVSALSTGIMAAAYTDEYAKGLELAAKLPTETPIQKLSKANMVFGWLGEGLAPVMGVVPAIRFAEALIKSLPETMDDQQKPMLFSSISNAYEALADLQMENGDKPAAEKALADGLAKITDDRFKRGLSTKATQLRITGETAADFTPEMKIGEFNGLSSLKGKVVLLDFFAHWCGPCKASFPDLRKLYADLQSKGVEIVHATRFYGSYGQEKGLKKEQEFEKMKGFVKEHQIAWPVVFVDAKTFDDFGVSGIPHLVLIDQNGKVKSFKIGYSPESFAEFRKKIEELIATKGN